MITNDASLTSADGKVEVHATDLMAQAMASFNQKKLDESENLCRQVLALGPDNFVPLQLLGIITALKGNVEESCALLSKAATSPYASEQTYYNYGLVLQGLGKLDQAIKSYDLAIHLKPDFSTAFNNRGIAFQKLGKLDQAIASFDEALKHQPSYAEAHFNKGVVIQGMGLLNEAIACYVSALNLKPDYPEAYNNRGLALVGLNQFAEAISNYDQAIHFRSNYAEAHNNKGLVLEELGQIASAIECYSRAISCMADYAGAHNNLGNALKELMLIELAKYHLNRALLIDPGFIEAKVNLSLLLLLSGEYSSGFTHYEWRWQNAALKLKNRDFGRPLWLGAESLKNKKILIHSEQGLGDCIQFVRYLFEISNLGGEIIFECEKSLHELLKPFTSFTTFIAKGESLPEFDYHCPLMSLPLALKTQLNPVPAPIPYLYADDNRIKKWRSYLGTEGYKIAICWQGSTKGKVDKGRSFPVRQFAQISKMPGVRLISVQKNEGVNQLSQLPSDVLIETLPDEFDSGDSAFLDSAAVLACVDLVITSDTALTHIAGAMGVKAWLALKYVPDWRWLLDREDSPWYPCHRLFRQKAMNDWATVFLEMETELKKLLNDNSKTPAAERKFETPFVPISWGELIDKITILELKKVNIVGLIAQANVEKEWQYLSNAIDQNNELKTLVQPLRDRLKEVNAELWQVEDLIREKESVQKFDDDFVVLARNVYQLNDQRALLKKKINQLLCSELIEEKSYKS